MIHRPFVASLSLAVMFTLATASASRAEPPQPLQPGDVILLDFGASWCGPCRSMAPVVAELAGRGWTVRHVDADREVDLVRRFAVTGVPCFVLLVKGEEKGRISGVTTLPELEKLMAKSQPASVDPFFAKAASASAARNAAAEVPGTPLPTTTSNDPLSVEPPGRGVQPPGGASPAKIVDTSAGGGGVPAAVSAAPPTQSSSPVPGSTPGVAPSSDITAKLLAATARLRVEDVKGVSWGTGSIIDCRQGEALILTCGHIFRDSKGKGRIEVDLFGSDRARGLAGQVISWDLERDLALVSVFTEEPIQPVRVGGVERRTTTGEQVVSVGCDGGDDPTVRASRVTGIDKYLGPANVQVAGQPVQGRSGGGLFAADGTLIGVCNAADPADNEGLFAALPAIHDQLEESGLGFVYRSAYPSNAAAQGGPLAATVPTMPAEMPAVSFDRRDRQEAVPTASTAATVDGSLSEAEQALLAHVRRHRGNAEVICIVRPHDVPNAESEVFVLQPTTAAAAP